MQRVQKSDHQYLLDYYDDDSKKLQNGDRLTELVLENVRFTGLVRKSHIEALSDEPLTDDCENLIVENI